MILDLSRCRSCRVCVTIAFVGPPWTHFQSSNAFLCPFLGLLLTCQTLPGACIHSSDDSSGPSSGFLDASNAPWPLLGLALTCQTPPWGVYSLVRRRFQGIRKPIWTTQTHLTSLRTDTTCSQYPWHLQIRYSV